MQTLHPNTQRYRKIMLGTAGECVATLNPVRELLQASTG